jgi:fucose permease
MAHFRRLERSIHEGLKHMSTPTSRRLLFYTFYLAYLSAGILSILPGPTLSLLAAHTGISLALAGWIFTCGGTGFALGAFAAGTKMLKPKTILMAGLLLMGTMGLAIPFIHSFPLLLMTIFIKGLGFGCVDVGVNILSALAFHDTLGESLNGLHSSFSIGSLVAPLLLSAALTLLHDFTWAYVVGSMTSLACAVLLMRQRPPTMPAGARLPQFESGQQPGVERPASSKTASRSILWQVLLWLMVLEFFFYIAAEVGFSDWIVTAVNTSASIALALAAPTATAFWLGLTTSRLLGSQVLKRALLSERQLLYLCISGGGVCGLLVAIFPGQLLIAFAASALYGFFLGPIYPGLMAIATRWFVHNLNTISGVLLICCGISGMVFPVLMGSLIASTGVSWGMAIPPLGCLLIVVPLFIATRRQRLTLQSQQRESTIETSPLSSFGQS